jgi:hypothetical protein
MSWQNDAGETLTVNTDSAGTEAADDTALITLTDSAGVVYGGDDGDDTTVDGNAATLVMTQTLERAHNIGGSMDYALDTKNLGAVILRAEALYQKDVYSPIIDRGKLSIGDLTGALTMVKGDKFKYVLGADVTVLTNMMISTQFIQERNLDFINSDVDFDGTACGSEANCGVYTADFATMHLTNGFNMAEENKNYYSLFFSKPFGSSAQHRWNNIMMYEDQGSGGKWNRLDAEFSLTDNVQFTAEYNKYWGDENTQFGQLAAASNAQVGFKYDF